VQVLPLGIIEHYCNLCGVIFNAAFEAVAALGIQRHFSFDNSPKPGDCGKTIFNDAVHTHPKLACTWQKTKISNKWELLQK